MGATRTELHPARFNKLAAVLQALGHPARLRIVDILIERNACQGHLLVDELGLSQPTVHQHLKRLQEVGLIKGSIDGNRICYCINPETYGWLGEKMHRFLYRSIGKQSC